MRRMRIAVVSLASIVLLACGARESRSSSDDVATSSGAEPTHGGVADEGPIAEVPFPAAQIRDATPAGRTYVFRFEEEGSQRFERWVFERVDANGYSFTSTPVDEEGQVVGEVERSEGTWDELEHHAHFPLDRTEITNAMLTIPLGAFRCRLYTVTSDDDGRSVVSRFWFANDLPGAPIRMVREVDGEPVVTMMLVGHEPPIAGR